MEFDPIKKFYENLNAYYKKKLGKKPPTINEVQKIIDDKLAAKV